MVDRSLTGKIMPWGKGRSSAVLEKSEAVDRVPPPELWDNYGPTEQDYLAGGKADVEIMLSILGEEVRANLHRVLDFGCAAGRMLRHVPRSGESEFWGVDVSAPHIRWCQENLRGLNFVLTTTAPHLPFADGYFDLVYAASVFTHISDLADAWLLEIARVLRPGGHAYLTVHDLRSYELLTTRSRYSEDPTLAELVKEASEFGGREAVRSGNVDAFWFGADPGSQVFYDPDYLIGKWGKWLHLVSYNPQVHNYQSALVLAKA